MKISIWLGSFILFLSICQGCLELTGSDDPSPCGAQLTCPAPKQCVNQVCLSQCLSDDECEEGQVCESLRCVPKSDEDSSDSEGGTMQDESSDL